VKFIVVFICVVALNCSYGYAQVNTSKIHFNQANGLPSNKVYDVFEDSLGFIWLATEAGLYRYDGFEYKLFASEKISSLAGSCIREDKYGRIWYENFDGYLSYIENGEINQIKQGNPIQFLPFAFNNKHLFVIVKDGVNVYDLKSLALIRTVAVDWIYAEYASLIEGQFVVTDYDKIVAIDSSLNVKQTKVGIARNLGIKLLAQIDKKIAVISRDGKSIRFYDKNLNFLDGYNLNLGGVYHNFSLFKNGEYYFSTSTGLKIISFSKEGKINRMRTEWEGHSVASYLEDKCGNKWVAMLDEGVVMLPKTANQTSYLLGTAVRRIIEHKNEYVVVARKGEVSLFDKDFQLKKKVHHDPNGVDYIHVPNQINQFIYANNKGLNIYDNGVVSNVNVALKQAARLDDKYFLVALSGFYGMYKNPFAKSNTVSKWDNLFSPNMKSLPEFSSFRALLRAKTVAYNFERNSLVAGTNIGTFLFENGVEKELKNNGATVFIKKAFWSKNDLFLLSTNGNFYKVTEAKSFERLNFPDYAVRVVKKVNQQFFLLGKNAIYSYDATNGQINTFDFDVNYNNINDFIVQGDEIILADDNGIKKIRFKNLEGKSKVIPFFINDLYANGIKTDDLRKLSYRENFIRINYSFLNYGRSGGVIVQYRLNNGNWVLANEKERDIYLPALAPGSYEISFKVNSNLVKDVVHISIAAPFWKTPWFYLMMFCFVVSLMVIYFTVKTKFYTKQIKLLNEKIQLEKSLSKSVLTSIKAQMNPHFFYNALNTIQAFIFTNDKLSANNYLAKFSKLTRLILEMSEKESVLLSEEIESIKMYLDLEKMRFRSKFDYKIAFKNITSIDGIEMPPMLVQPLIENAVKHGLLNLQGAGKLEITFEAENDYLFIYVEDNGVGRKKSAALNQSKLGTHRSFATKANTERVNLLNNNRIERLYQLQIIDKYNENNEATGTIAKLTIPLD
jgi:hypothetical protein